MKKAKNIIFISIILGVAFFLFAPEILPKNIQRQEILDMVADNDIVIFFNSGGWGNTPLEKAEDFAPIIEGIQITLNEWGYDSIVIPYNRTKDGLLGKISGTKDFLGSFSFSSEILAKDLEFLAESLPNKKIIIAGLSNGATFVAKTNEKISKEMKASIYTIAIGAPFWTKTPESDNVLQLDNNGRDSLTKGNVGSLILGLIKAPFKWVSSIIQGDNLGFAQVVQAPGHDYNWFSPEVGPQIITFLEDRFKK